jgi:hypothetical protein
MSIESGIKADAEKALTVLEAVGKDFAKGLTVVVKYAPEGAALANAIFPASIAVTPEAVAAVNLLQNTILATEAKYAASGAATGTGAQKAAEVLAVSGPAAASLLTSAGAPASTTTRIGNIVTAIVGVMNVQTAVAAA